MSFGADRPLVTAEAVKRRLMEMSREQGKTKSTATIYKVEHIKALHLSYLLSHACVVDCLSVHIPAEVGSAAGAF